MTLTPKSTALVVIDLEYGIVARDLKPYTSTQVVASAVLLADALRAVGGTIVWVHVQLGDVPRPPADRSVAAPVDGFPASASELLPTLGIQPQDHVSSSTSGVLFGTRICTKFCRPKA